MRKILVVFSIIFQIALLAGMAGQRELIVRTGKTVYFRTRPVDPQDMFRGEYARLDYDISHVKCNLLKDGLAGINSKQPDRTVKDRRVYAVLDIGDDNLGQILYLTDKKPEDGTFIRGWLNNYYSFGNTVDIRYGIEAFFVEQGSSQKLQRPRRQDISLAMEMEAALSKNGTAVLKGYRFVPIAVGIEPNFVLDANTPAATSAGFVMPARRQQRIKSVKLKLLNVSEKPYAIVDLPGGLSFSLEQDTSWSAGETWQWVGQNTPRSEPQNSDVHILKPDEIYEVNIDLTNPAWFVTNFATKKERTLPVGELGWQRFRMIYRPPSKEQCRGLDNANIIWHGYVHSPAFSGSQGFD